MAEQFVGLVSQTVRLDTRNDVKASGNAVPAGKTVPDGGKALPVVDRVSPDIEELARVLNLASQSIGRDLRFEVDLENGKSVIQVLDRETGEIIRQIPPEKAALYSTGSGAVQIRLYNAHV